MDIAELHAGWSRKVATEFLRRHVLPALSSAGLGSRWTARTTMVRFATRSAIFRHDSGGASYAVKLWGPSTPPSHTAEAAFGWLQRLRQDDRTRAEVPSTAPVLLLPEVGTVVMEWVDLPNLRDLIVGGDRERGLAGVGAAFAWLERFHRLDGPVVAPFRAQLRVRKLLQLLNRHDALIPPADRSGVQRIADRVQALALELRNLQCEARVLHHDATCANFFFDGTRAIGIDLHERKHDDPLVDYCKLLSDADALLGTVGAVEPPFAIGRQLQDLLLGTPLLDGGADTSKRIRFQLLATSFANYGKRLSTTRAEVMHERARYLAVADALASDAFVAAATAPGAAAALRPIPRPAAVRSAADDGAAVRM